MSKIPSIAMIPSGYKASKLYSVLPTDGTGDFTTSRASIATRVNENGLIEEVAANVPRLDYSDGGCPSLLLEPTATNLITYSEDFTQWQQNGVSTVSNSAISPDGTLNANKLETTTDGARYVSQSLNLTLGTTYTYSAFVKKGLNDWCYLLAVGGVDVADSTFDISNGVVGSSVQNTIPSENKIEDFGNGWYRCSITFTPTVSTSFGIRMYNADSISDVNTLAGAYTYIYGAQLEENSYTTSYIKTVGTTQTRVADTASGSGNSTVINSTEGTLYFEGSFPSAKTSSNLRIAISDTTANNRVFIQNISASANRLQFYVVVGGVVYTDFSLSVTDITAINKIAFKYKENDFSIWINGIKVLTDTSGITFPNGTLTELAFDGGDGGSPFYGKTKDLRVYTTALSDAELTNLTTI